MIESAEADGIAAFSGSDHLVADCMNKLTEAMAVCTGGLFSISSYESGAFRSQTKDLGLRELHLAMTGNQEERIEFAGEIESQIVEDREAYLVARREEAVREKEKWAGYGTALQVVLVGTAVVGVVASGGLLAFAFSAVTLIGSVSGLRQRTDQLAAMQKDSGADMGDSAVAEITEGIGDTKTAVTSLDKAMNAQRIYDDGYVGYDDFNQTVIGAGERFLTDLILDGSSKVIDAAYGDKLGRICTLGR